MSITPIVPAVIARLKGHAGVRAVYREQVKNAFDLAEAVAINPPVLFVVPVEERGGPINAMTGQQRVMARVGVLAVLRRGGSALPDGDLSDFLFPVIDALQAWQPAIAGAGPAAYAGGALAQDDKPQPSELRWLMGFDFSFSLDGLTVPP